MSGFLLPVALLLVLICISVEAKWNYDYCATLEATNTSTAVSLNCPVENLGNVAYCSANNRTVYIQACYCMTFEQDNVTAVGNCILTCASIPHYCVPWNGNKTQFNIDMCSGAPVNLNFSRRGMLCGRCNDDYGSAAYSYDYVTCTECDGFHIKNLIKYIGTAYGPLTLFFFFVIIFRLNITSGPLNAYVFFCQIATLPVMTRLFAVYNESVTTLGFVYISFLSVWNLDFFRGNYEPFCLFPKSSPEGTLLLDYLVAVYPLLLVLVTYCLVVLYDRNYRIITAIWKPVHKFANRLREQWNVRSSLIDAFATFFLLSYVKVLSVSFDLLMYANVYDAHGYRLKRHIFYNDPTLKVNGSHAYVPLAVGVFTVFIFSPLALLCLYPCRCFQRCLNRCGSRCLPLHAFMDVFTGCYRLSPRDCRYFAGLYLLMRIIVLVIFQATLTVFFVPALAIFLVVSAIVFAIARPYKNPTYNVVDVVILLFGALALLTLGSKFIAEYSASRLRTTAIKLSQTAPILFILYPVGLALLWAWKLIQLGLHRASERAKEDGDTGERKPLMPTV